MKFAALSFYQNGLRPKSLELKFRSRWCVLIAHRAFSASSSRRLRVSEFSEADFRSLRVNQERLMGDIHHTCQWGTGERWGDAETETGMRRLALSDSDKAVRDWFVSETKSLGCTTTIDVMGNIFAVRPGLRNDMPPVYAGSHLDTQPSGGRYDGILGVLAAVEMLRVLNENWVETEYPVGVVNWTNEEGARFPISMVSSGVWAGQIPLEHAQNLHEITPGTGKTMRFELERIEYLGDVPASHTATPMAAHFELHIEQGPILEAENRKIGIVKGVQAYKWYTITVRGRPAHTGTTPLKSRADPLLLASKMIIHSQRLAKMNNALASTGILTLNPTLDPNSPASSPSTNTLPSAVQFSLDIRAPTDEIVETMEKAIRQDFQDLAGAQHIAGKEGHFLQQMNDKLAQSLPCTVDMKTDSVSPAVVFHEDCISCVRDAAANLFASGANEVSEAGGEASDTPQAERTTRVLESLTKEMVSGAGHDSVNTSKICPTSMIFVPCKDGVSHNPAEYTKPEDCATGVQVLLGAVLRYDKLRKERGD